jgi:hypothetical protein
MSMAEMLADLDAEEDQEAQEPEQASETPEKKSGKTSKKAIVALGVAIAAGAIYDNTKNDSKYTDQLRVAVGSKTQISDSIESVSSMPVNLQNIAYVTLKKDVTTYKKTGVEAGKISASNTQYLVKPDTVFMAGDIPMIRIGRKFVPLNPENFDMVQSEKPSFSSEAFKGIQSITFEAGAYAYEYIYHLYSNSIIKAPQKANVTIKATKVEAKNIVKINGKSYFSMRNSSARTKVYIEAVSGVATFDTLTTANVSELKDMSTEAQQGLVSQVVQTTPVENSKDIYTEFAKESIGTLEALTSQLTEQEVKTFFGRFPSGLGIYGKNVTVDDGSIVLPLGETTKQK